MGRRTLTGALVLAVVVGAFLLDRARGGPAWACAALVALLALGATWELLTIGRAPRAVGMALVLVMLGVALAAGLGLDGAGGHGGTRPAVPSAWLSSVAALVFGAGLLWDLRPLGRAPHAGEWVVAGIAVAALAGLLPESWAGASTTLAGLSLLTIALVAGHLGVGPSERLAALAARPFVAVLFAGGLVALVPLLLQGRLAWVFWIVIVAKTSDIAAYYTGRTLGRHALAPRTSPSKTIEGAVGAVIAPALLAALPFTPFAGAFGTAGAALAGALVGGIAILSDLVESAVKRSVGAKDSGRLLGEAGGLLDLVDSLLLLAPIAWMSLEDLLAVAGGSS